MAFNSWGHDIEKIVQGDPDAIEQVLAIIKYYTELSVKCGVTPEKGSSKMHSIQLMKELDTEEQNLKARLKQLAARMTTLERINAEKQAQILALAKKLGLQVST